MMIMIIIIIIIIIYCYGLDTKIGPTKNAVVHDSASRLLDYTVASSALFIFCTDFFCGFRDAYWYGGTRSMRGANTAFVTVKARADGL